MADDTEQPQPSMLMGCVQGVAIIGFGCAIVVVAIYVFLTVGLPLLGIHDLFGEPGLGGPGPSASP